MKTVRGMLGPLLTFSWKTVAVTIISTLLLIIDAYHQLTPVKAYDRLILYLAIPFLIIVLVFRENPGSYGFGLGDWKAGLALTACGMLLAAPVLWLVSHGGSMQRYYQPQVGALPWNTLLDLLGWEFFFRGFILFAYARTFGPDALWLQAVPFALAHIGKPELETLSTIFGGFVFGWIAYRTRSFLYPLLLHWFVASFTILVAARVLA